MAPKVAKQRAPKRRLAPHYIYVVGVQLRSGYHMLSAHSTELRAEKAANAANNSWVVPPEVTMVPLDEMLWNPPQ